LDANQLALLHVKEARYNELSLITVFIIGGVIFPYLFMFFFLSYFSYHNKMNMEKKKRQHISLETKYEMCQMRKKGDTPGNIAKHFEIKSSSTVSTILGQSAKIISEFEKNSNENDMVRNKTAKRIKLPTYHDVDSAVQDWFTQATIQTNVVIGGPEIQAQALKYASMLNKPEFQASNGWLQRFRARNHISYKTIVGEAGLVDKTVTDEYLNNTLPNLIRNYTPRDIFNADETALFYKAQPAKAMVYKNMDANTIKKCKERRNQLCRFCMAQHHYFNYSELLA